MQLTVRDIAALLHVPEQEVYRWIDDEELPAYRIEDQYRFNRAELLEWANARKIPVPASLFAQQPAGSAGACLADALESGGAHYGLDAPDKPSALQMVAQAMPLPAVADRSHLAQILSAREALASTGVGDGIAIPHVRNPVIFPVRRPIVTLFGLARPIEFGALDGKPVHTLFTLVSPTVRTHLQLLSHLAFCLRDAEFREAIHHRLPITALVQLVRQTEASVKESTVREI